MASEAQPPVPKECWGEESLQGDMDATTGHMIDMASEGGQSKSAITPKEPMQCSNTQTSQGSTSTSIEPTSAEPAISEAQNNDRVPGEGQLDLAAAESLEYEGTDDGGDDDEGKGIQSLSDSAILLKGGSGIVYLELPEGPEGNTSEEETSGSIETIESNGTLTKQRNETAVSEFSESVRLLKDHGGIAFCGKPETIDDSYATLQISNLMSTVLEDIQGKNRVDFDEYEPEGRSIDKDGLFSPQKPLDYLDIADCSSSDASTRQPLLVPSDNTLHFHDLPDDVMHYVFSMFAVNELCSNVIPVCQRWRQLASDPIHYQQLNVGHLPTESLCAILERAPLLKRLNLGSRDELTLDEIDHFTQKCPLLQELNLAFCDTLNNFLLKLITNTCTNLQQINLEGCLAVDDDSLELLTHLPHLSRINLSHCSMVQTEGVEALATKLQRITELNIDGIPYVTDNAILLLVKHHGRHIEKLVVDGAELSDAAIKALTDCHVLVELKLSFAELLTDVALYHLKNLKKPLKALKLKKGSDFSTESLLDLFLSGCLSSLQSLDMSECVQLLDEGLQAMVKCCGATLRHLSLCWCWNITDPGLDAIVDNCPLMETLELVGVHKVKGHCLARIPSCMPHLTLLDLQQCNQVIDELVVEVVRKLPKLVAYNYYGERFQFVSKDVLMIK